VQLIDSHVHIDDVRFNKDLAEVLSRARNSSVVAQIVPGVHAGNWVNVRSVCQEHDDLFPCYGLHPCFMSQHVAEHTHELAAWLGREPTVAVGECGLDYAVADLDKAAQQRVFAAQLSLAREFRLPVVIHAHKAVEDVIRMVRGSGQYRGMVHSFNGSLQQAHRLIDLGYKLGFGGAITYTRATRLRDLISKLPLEAIVLETDAPDQPNSQHFGERNEPAFLLEVWQQVSELRDEDADTIAETTTRTASELFSLPVVEVA